MWDVYSFDKKFNFSNFDTSKTRSLIEDLKLDFKLDFEGVRDFKAIQQLVFNLLQKVNYFGNVSNGKVPCSLVWKVLFTDVFVTKVKIGQDKSFFDLYYFFDDKDKWFNGDRKKNSQPINPVVALQEYLEYMGLSKNFTAKELKRRYRKLCLKYHPDKPNGSAKEFNRLQEVRRELEKTINVLTN